MYYIRKYNFIIALVVFFPIYSALLSELYTYYFEPIKYEKDIRANVVVEKGVKGVRNNLVMKFYLNNGKYRIATIWANNLSEQNKNIYIVYNNMEISANFYYKVNPCSYCFSARKIIPIYAYKNGVVFLDKHGSNFLFFERIYKNLRGFIIAILVFYLVIFFRL